MLKYFVRTCGKFNEGTTEFYELWNCTIGYVTYFFILYEKLHGIWKKLWGEWGRLNGEILIYVWVYIHWCIFFNFSFRIWVNNLLFLKKYLETLSQYCTLSHRLAFSVFHRFFFEKYVIFIPTKAKCVHMYLSAQVFNLTSIIIYFLIGKLF